MLTLVIESTEKHWPFSMASSREIAKEDREFICKLMQLDPRDRPSAKALLQDAWLAERTTDPQLHDEKDKSLATEHLPRN